MRFTGLVLATSVVVLGACGGGDKAASDNNAAPAGAPAAAPAAGGAPTSTATPAPITGKTYEVKMVLDEKSYHFDPANLTIKVGDGIKFVNVSGSPHNVAFNTVPDASKAQLDANMPSQTANGPSPKLGELSGPLMITPNDNYTVSFAGVKPGVYGFNCTPHLALNMKGEVTVQ